MKISLLLTIGYTMFSFSGSFSQSVKESDTTPNNTVIPTGKDIKRVLREQFTALVTGQSNYSFGNFAAIETKDAAISFGGSVTVDSSANVFNIKISGGASDGVSSLFTNSKINSNVGISLQYNRFINNNKSFSYFHDSFVDHKLKEQEIMNDYKMALIEIQNDSERKKITNEKVDLGKKLIKIRSQIKSDVAILMIAPQQNLDSLTQRVDSLQHQLAKTELDSIINNQNLVNLPNSVQAEINLNNETSDKLDSNKLQLKLFDFELAWFTFGYGVTNNSFRLFDPSSVFSDQISRKSFLGHEFRIQYANYHWSKARNKTRYFNIGTTYTIANNLNDLDDMEVSDQSQYNSGQSDRVVAKKYNVYAGIYDRHSNYFRLYADYYHFLLKNNPLAFHVFPDINIKKGKNVSNLGFGILFVFYDQTKDDKSIVNAELYYQIVDLFDANSSGIPLRRRNDIGLRVSFPITFKTK